MLKVVENSVIASILADPRYTKTWPCLKKASQKASRRSTGCRSCGRKNRNVADAYTQAKNCIMGMNSANKLKFKKLLGASKVRLFLTDSKGQTRKITF